MRSAGVVGRLVGLGPCSSLPLKAFRFPSERLVAWKSAHANVGNHPAMLTKFTFRHPKLRSRPPDTSLCHSPPFAQLGARCQAPTTPVLAGAWCIGAAQPPEGHGTTWLAAAAPRHEPARCSSRSCTGGRLGGALNGGDGPRWCGTNTTATAGSRGGPAVATAEGSHIGRELDDGHRTRPEAARIARAHPRAAPGAFAAGIGVNADVQLPMGHLRAPEVR